jgi:hypothetical protein
MKSLDGVFPKFFASRKKRKGLLLYFAMAAFLIRSFA